MVDDCTLLGCRVWPRIHLWNHPQLERSSWGKIQRREFTPTLSCIWGHMDASRLLLDQGAHIDDEDNYGKTPLNKAAANSKLETVRLLLSRGARKGIKDKEGRIPLDIADQLGKSDVARLFK